jgi:integrase/recombinase XerD
MSLSDHLDNYLKLRRQLGFKLHMQGSLLRSFVLFAKRDGASFVTTKLALRWAIQPSNIKPVQRANRLGIVRRFAEYLNAMDSRHEIPPQGLLGCRYCRPTPYLFRDETVRKLIKTAQQARSTKNHEIRGSTYAALLGLLAVTGMRVGEALALDREDVDLDRALLTIRRGKGNKSRLIPLHPSTLRALKQYAHVRDRIYSQPLSPSFFLSATGKRLHYVTLNGWFIRTSRRLGLRSPTGRHGPRIHDLRHYFAIRTLLDWYRSNIDVEVHLPELATYLGHVHVRHTYWYLSATPELLQLATLRWRRREGGRYA